MVKQYFIEHFLPRTHNSLTTQSPIWIIDNRRLPKKQTVSNKISIIIVNWNTKIFTAKCLKSIYKNSTLISEIIIVDNGSTDDSVPYLKKHFLKIRLIQNKKNYGYAKANNQGVKIAKNELILILNPDTQIQKNTIEKLVSYYNNNQNVGAVVPLLLNTNRSVQYFYHRKLPTVKFLVASLIYNYTPYKNFPLSKELFLLNQDFKKVTQIEQAAGVCILTSKSTIKKVGGLFDNNLPIFLNDVDFSKRLKNKKLNIFLIPESKIIHEKSSSTGKLEPYTLRQESLLAHIYYFKKNHNLIIYIAIKATITATLSLLIILTIFKITNTYLKTPIYNRRQSIKKQFDNLIAVIKEQRNHPGLIVNSKGQIFAKLKSRYILNK